LFAAANPMFSLSEMTEQVSLASTDWTAPWESGWVTMMCRAEHENEPSRVERAREPRIRVNVGVSPYVTVMAVISANGTQPICTMSDAPSTVHCVGMCTTPWSEFTY